MMTAEDRMDLLQSLPYGIFFLTTKITDPNSAIPYAGALVSWVCQVSFQPPMLMVALKKDSRIQRAVAQSRVFALNFIASDQLTMATELSKNAEFHQKKFNEYDIELGGTGVPLLKDSIGCLECKVELSLDKGDHTLFIADVLNAYRRSKNIEVLLLKDTSWQYGG